jgi:hypothetical protein
MTSTTETVTIQTKQTEVAPETHREPLKLSGALNSYKSFDKTPVIGREYVEGNLKEWLRAPNSDELIRDLAITSRSINLQNYIMHLQGYSLATRRCFLP